jgi:hypothetical protein
MILCEKHIYSGMHNALYRYSETRARARESEYIVTGIEWSDEENEYKAHIIAWNVKRRQYPGRSVLHWKVRVNCVFHHNIQNINCPAKTNKYPWWRIKFYIDWQPSFFFQKIVKTFKKIKYLYAKLLRKLYSKIFIKKDVLRIKFYID